MEMDRYMFSSMCLLLYGEVLSVLRLQARFWISCRRQAMFGLDVLLSGAVRRLRS